MLAMGWNMERTKEGEAMVQQRESEKLRRISQSSQVNAVFCFTFYVVHVFLFAEFLFCVYPSGRMTISINYLDNTEIGHLEKLEKTVSVCACSPMLAYFQPLKCYLWIHYLSFITLAIFCDNAVEL